jgi:hypothetical protein
MKKQASFYIFIVCLLNLIISKDKELENRAKLVACLNLTRARMSQDRVIINTNLDYNRSTTWITICLRRGEK